jgi:ATP-binding cassette subfamily F protein uup
VTLLSLDKAVKGFEDRVLLREVDLQVADGERIGLLGRNGSGKSTLMRVLAGLEPLDAGQRVVRRGLRLGYLEQDPALDPALSARELVRAGLAGREALLAELGLVHARLERAHGADLERELARQADLEARLERLGGHDVEHRVESTLQALGLERFDEPCGRLSGGERRRVALARLLLADPELLLLDEPTNHLDAFVTDWLEDWFLQTRTPLVLVTHDRYFLDRVVDRIVELENGRLFACEGGYGEYLQARSERLESERRDEASRQLLLRRETAWMRRGPPARTTKAKARIHRYHDLVEAAPEVAREDLELSIPPGPRLGDRVVRLKGVSKAFGARTVLPRLDLELAPGERLGLVGPNGAGKTTLISILLGDLAPDTGAREVGETVRFMGIDQLRAELDPARTVLEELAGRNAVVRTDGRDVRVEGFLDRFGFPPAQQRALVGQLSGGERARLLLSKLVCRGGNVVVLDEPTNDLDLATLRALEEALLAFEGAAVLVSHDRWFLDRVATRILYLDGRGGARVHHGDLSGLLALLAAERAAAREAGKRAAPDRDAPVSSAAKAAKPRRLSPWQERELGEIESAIAAREARRGELDARLAAPELWTGPREVAAAVQAERDALEIELEELYGRWETLEALR